MFGLQSTQACVLHRAVFCVFACEAFKHTVSPSLPLEAKLAVQRCVTDHLPRLSSTLFMPLFFARFQGDTVDSRSLSQISIEPRSRFRPATCIVLPG